MDLDLALWTEPPPSFTTESSVNDKKAFEKWDRFNRMSLMIMKCATPETFNGIMSEETNAKMFLEEIEKYFATNEKAQTSMLLASLVSIRYKGK